MQILPYYGNTGIINKQQQKCFVKKQPFSVSFQGSENEIYPKEALSGHEELRARYYKEFCGINIKSRISDIVPNFESLNDNKRIFMGGMDAYSEEPSNLKYAKSTGIDKIIDLRGSASNTLKKACEQYDIEYISYPMKEGKYWKHSIFNDYQDLCNKKRQHYILNKNITPEKLEQFVTEYQEKLYSEQDEFVDEFAKIINELKKGNCQIGCLFADIRTPALMSLIARIDPETYGCVNSTLPISDTCKNYFKNFIENLTAENKAKLGITKEIEKALRSAIQHAKM